jgi:ABC-type transporter Mla MlaB component
MEPVGRALLKHAKVLGAGTRMNRHSQSLLEHSVKGDWKVLREELAKTQFDVEAEMLQLRDVDIAHLVSLGGWLRAFEIATKTVTLNYAPEKTRNLARRDIAEYYLMSLESLHPQAQALPIVKRLRKGLEELMPMVDVPEGKELTLEEVKPLAAKAAELAKIVVGE